MLVWGKVLVMRILVGTLVLGLTFALCLPAFWYSYLGLYWLAGKVSGSSIGFGLIFVAPVCMLIAFAFALWIVFLGMSLFDSLMKRFGIPK